MLEYVIIGILLLILARVCGVEISMPDKEDKIIYHPPPPGAPLMAGHFEVPRNSEGERFLNSVINRANDGPLPEDLEKILKGKDKEIPKDSTTYI